MVSKAQGGGACDSRDLNMTQTKHINKQTTFLNRYIAKLHLNVIISL
jgi:hypothetical protein